MDSLWPVRSSRLFLLALLLALLPAAAARASVARPGTSLGVRSAPVTEARRPPAITATKQDALLVDVDGDTQVDPGDTLRYTVVIGNGGDETATGVTFTDTVDLNTSYLPGSLRTTPLARADSYSAIGNVRIQISDGALDLLVNDVDLDGGSVTVASAPATSTNGGNLSVSANGSFSYDPPPGFEGVDSFTYTVQDDEGEQDSAVVTITVGEVIWFINDGAPGGGDGRLTAPFNSTVAFNASAADEAGDILFLYQGSAPYSGGLTLLDNQQLIGQGVDLASVTGIVPPPGSDPLPGATSNPTVANPAGSGVTLAQGNTLRGLTIGDTITDISGSTFGTLTVSTVTLGGTGRALNLNSGTLAATFTSIASANSTAEGLLLNGVGGTLLSSGGTTITNPALEGLRVSTSSAALTFGNSSVNGSGATGVRLNSNSGAITFADLDIAPDSGQRALHGTGNTGTLKSSSGTLSATTAAAVEIVGTSAASRTPLDLQLTSVSSTGGPSGVILTHTATAGTTGFRVLGGGGSCTSAASCTGGAIQSTSNAGILLTNATNVSFTRLFLGATGSHGVAGSGMADSTAGVRPTFELQASRVTGTGNDDNESALYFGNSSAPGNNSGRLRVADTVVDLFLEVGLAVANDSGALVVDVTGTPTLAIPTSTMIFEDNHDTFGTNGILVESYGSATITVNVTGAYFNNIEGAAISLRSGATASFFDANLMGNIVRNGGGPDNFPSGGGFDLISDAGGDFNFDVKGNDVRNSEGDGVVVIAEGDVQGRIGGPSAADGNVFSGLTLGDGIRIDTEQLDGPGAGNNFTVTILVQNNQIGSGSPFPGIGDDGIQLLHRDGTKVLNLTIEDNSIANTTSEGIRFFSDADVSDGATLPDSLVRVVDNTFSTIGTPDAVVWITQETARSCLHMTGNPFAGANRNIFLSQAGGSVLQITQASTAALAAANAGSTASSSGAPTFNGSCLNPPLPTNPVAAPPAEPAEEVTSPAPPSSVPARLFTDAREQGQGSATGGEAISQESEKRGVPLADVELAIGTLVPGEALTLTFSVMVDSPLPSGVSSVANQGRVTGSNFAPVLTDDPDSGAMGDPTVTTVAAVPDLQLSKSDGGISAQPGDTISYTLIYTNAGNQGATGVTLSEMVPGHTTFDAGASSAGWSCADDAPAGTACMLTVGSLVGAGSGSATFAVTVGLTPPAGVTSISNTASIADDGANGADPNPANNSDTTLTPLERSSDLVLGKSGTPDTIESGATVTYTLVVTNSGPALDGSVVVTDTLPGDATYQGDSCGTTASGANRVWSVGALPSGQVASCEIVVQINSASPQLCNSAMVAGANGDPDSSNNSAFACTDINTPPLLTSVFVTSPVNEGGSATLSGTFSDPDPDSLTLVVAWGDGITDTFPYPSGSTTFNENHTYLDDDPTATPSDPVTVEVTLTDSRGGRDDATTGLTVNNVAPTVEAGQAVTVTVGMMASFNGSFTDPGTQDSHTIVWDFGDGSGTSGTLTPTHSYSMPGTYTVQLTVTDDDTGSGSDSLQLVVLPQPTAITLGELVARRPPLPVALLSGGLGLVVALAWARRRR